MKVGDAITVLPSGRTSTVRALTIAGTTADRALPGDAIAVELADHVDVGRGDVLVVTNASSMPTVTRQLSVDVCWMADAPARSQQRVLVKHLASQVGATITTVTHRLNPATLARESVDSLDLNDLGRLELQLDEPIAADRYSLGRATGHLVLIDESSNATAAAATIHRVS